MSKSLLAVVGTAGNEIPTPVVPYVETNPVSVLQDDELRARFFIEIEQTVVTFQPRLETERGRKEIASLAYKIARTKTAIDEAGKALNEESRKKINAVDAVRREARDRLDSLRDRARAPLDEWEQVERERLAKIERMRAFLIDARIIGPADTPQTVSDRIAEVEHTPDDEVFTELRAETVEWLRDAHARLVKEEADRAELERLRAEAAERDRKEAAEREAREAAERKAREDQAQKERIEVAERAAAEAAAAKAREAAQADIDRLTAEKEALARAEAERVAEEDRQAAAQAQRERDIKHRSAIMTAAKEAIMAHCELDEKTAKAVVTAIQKGQVPAVAIQF